MIHVKVDEEVIITPINSNQETEEPEAFHMLSSAEEILVQRLYTNTIWYFEKEKVHVA